MHALERWLFQCRMRACRKSNVARNLLVITISVSHWFVFSALHSLGLGTCRIKFILPNLDETQRGRDGRETQRDRGTLGSSWKDQEDTRTGSAGVHPSGETSCKGWAWWGCHSTKVPGVITSEPHCERLLCPAVEAVCLSLKSHTVKILLLAEDPGRTKILQCSWAFTACWALLGPLCSD